MIIIKLEHSRWLFQRTKPFKSVLIVNYRHLSPAAERNLKLVEITTLYLLFYHVNLLICSLVWSLLRDVVQTSNSKQLAEFIIIKFWWKTRLHYSWLLFSLLLEYTLSARDINIKFQDFLKGFVYQLVQIQPIWIVLPKSKSPHQHLYLNTVVTLK